MLQKGFTHVILVLVLAIAAVSFLFLSSDLKEKVLPLQSPLPTYSPERRAQDARISEQNRHFREGSEGPLVFIEQDLTQINERFHLDITKLATPSASPISCLGVIDNEFSTLLNVDERIDNDFVKEYITEIESHLFSDENKLYLDDSLSSYTVENKGERSIHKVTFNQICKDNNRYFFIFDSYGEKTHIGGGGSEPTHFAYTNYLGDLVIIENIISSMRLIQLPPSEDDGYSVPNKTNSIAYYGCRRVYASSNNEVLIGCGGGDGPASGGGVFSFNFTNNKGIEKSFCASNGAGKYSLICFDENGDKYVEELNKLD